MAGLVSSEQKLTALTDFNASDRHLSELWVKERLSLLLKIQIKDLNVTFGITTEDHGAIFGSKKSQA